MGVHVPDDDKGEDVDTDRVDDDATEGAEALGDAGKKALDAMKTKWRAERDKAKAAETELAKLRTDRPKPAEGEAVDPEKVREQARAEVRAETLRERALDKVEAKAAKLFADPEDAVALLGRRVDDFIDDGKVDVEAIAEALDDLLKKKPHLAAAQSGNGRRFAGSADGGTRNGSSRPAQVTEQDLKRMTAQEIVKARQDGRLETLMGTS